MRQQIEKYINSIIVDVHYGDITYYGDGQGDFEQSSKNATEECLKNYIEYCKDQIQIAKTELKKYKRAQQR